MTDETNKIIQELFQKSHRFLSEDEIVGAALEAKLSLFDTNAIIEALINKGVYISDNIHDALKNLNKEKKEKTRTILSRKSPESATTFSMLHIPVGSELTFLKDREVIAITIDDMNRIRLKDGSLEGSTSRLAQILGVKFGYADVARQGPRWWLYQGKTLLAIREELEND